MRELSSSPQCRTSVPVARRRWRRSPGQAGASGRARRRLPRRHGARPLRDGLRGFLDDPVDGPGSSGSGGRRGEADPRDRGAAFRPRGAAAVAPRGQHRFGRRWFLAARGDHRPPRGRTDPRQGLAWAKPGRDARARLRRAGGGGRSRRRDGRGAGGADRSDPRERRTRDQPAGSLQSGGEQDDPGARARAVPRSACSTHGAASS